MSAVPLDNDTTLGIYQMWEDSYLSIKEIKVYYILNEKIKR